MKRFLEMAIVLRFFQHRGGVVAIEFAILLPIVLAILVASVEATRAIDNYRKVTLLARTLADLTAQGDSTVPMSSAALNDIVASSSLVLSPFSTARTTIRISSLGVYLSTLNLRPFVCSAAASNISARVAQKSATDLIVPAQFQTTGMRYVLVEVTSPFTPVFGSALINAFGFTSSLTFGIAMPWPARGGTAVNSSYPEIILPNGSACPTLAI